MIIGCELVVSDISEETVSDVEVTRLSYNEIEGGSLDCDEIAGSVISESVDADSDVER